MQTEVEHRGILQNLQDVASISLRFGKESRSISYDAMRASLAIVFVRYLILAWEQRVNTDVRTIGDLFFKYAEELQEAN